MPNLKQNQHTPLNVTQEARHRVFVGLAWDPNEKYNVIDEAKALMGGKPIHHDLDLSCYIYNAEKTLIQCVSAEAEHAVDKSGKIYHSGDNTEGLGDGDDEQISVELKDLDPAIAHIIFVANIKSGHNFGEVASPEIRLGDGYSDHTLHQADLSDARGKTSSSYIFARLYRGADGWAVHNIDEFKDTKNDDISAVAKNYID